MRFLSDILFRLRALFRRDDADAELRDELAFHLEMDKTDLRARGFSDTDADREARRRFGSVTAEAERARDGWGINIALEFVADVKHALRQMRRRPAFSAVVTLALGLGIGATVALFSVVNDLVLQPLPYGNVDRAHVFWSDYNWRGEEYDYVRERLGRFEQLAAYSTNGGPYRANPGGDDGAELLPYVVSTHTLFDVLGVRPMLGRAFSADDDRAGAPPVIVVSYGMWQQDLGASPDVIGRQIMLDGQLVTIIGVMPRGFYFPVPELRAWRPLQLDPATRLYRDVGFLTLLSRAPAGATPELVDAEVQRIARSLGDRFTYSEAWDKTRNAFARPVQEYLTGDMQQPLLLLLGAVALLLIIASANAAALVLARTSDREGEMSMRAALGAGRWRLARQIVAESLVLAVGAGIVGAAIAAAGFRLLVARLPLQHGFSGAVTTGWATYGAAFGLALLIGLALAAAPVRAQLRRAGTAAINRERSETGLRRGTRRFHGGIIAGQVTLAVLLLSGAALLVRSVDRIRAMDPGFDPNGVATFTIVANSRAAAAERRQFFDEAVARLARLPGMTAVGLTNRLPVRDGGYQGPVGIEGRPDLNGPRRPNSLYRLATPGFVRGMGMRILEGRDIDSSDVAAGRPTVLVTETFARRIWPGESALGKRVTTSFSGTAVTREIVGVIAETRLTSMTGEIPLAIFVPFAQHEPAPEGAVLVVRTSGALATLMPAVRREIAALDPDVAVARVESMEQVVSTALAQPLRLRFFLSLFAAIALLIGALGVYGVVSYAVARRRAEFAIRLALGATPSVVLRNVLTHGLAPVLAGVVLGVGSALLLAGLVERFLYGVAPTDAVSLATAAMVLLAAAIIAAIGPAIRAGHTSPSRALRAE